MRGLGIVGEIGIAIAVGQGIEVGFGFANQVRA